MLKGLHETLTEVMVGGAGGTLPLLVLPPPPHPAKHNDPTKERANKVL
jgi:hypothetical protein